MKKSSKSIMYYLTYGETNKKFFGILNDLDHDVLTVKEAAEKICELTNEMPNVVKTQKDYFINCISNSTYNKNMLAATATGFYTGISMK